MNMKIELKITVDEVKKLRELYEQAATDLEIARMQMRQVTRKNPPETGNSPRCMRLDGTIHSDSILELIRFLDSKVSFKQPYSQETGQRADRNHDLIQDADLVAVRELIMYFIRYEHWCDGAWESLVERGFLEAIISRLEVLLMMNAGSVDPEPIIHD